MYARLTSVLVAWAAVMAIPALGWAQHQHAASDASVDFGILPTTTPLGPPPCLQAGGIGGPADPCAYLIHRLTPEEVTVAKGGQVTFQVHGGGHGLAIYEVSKDTTRNELGQYLCAGLDPSTIADPEDHDCNLLASNANARHVVADGKGDVVIVADANPTGANTHPLNRVWYEPGRLMSMGGNQFLNGGTAPANGQLISYRFLKAGRYLVICMNRVHFLNDWMFGFVNVVGDR